MLAVSPVGADWQSMNEIEIIGTVEFGRVHIPLPGLARSMISWSTSMRALRFRRRKARSTESGPDPVPAPCVHVIRIHNAIAVALFREEALLVLAKSASTVSRVTME